jgi:hypothetical protein
MQQLASKNFQSVDVYIKGEDKSITMSPDKGYALMEYLTEPNGGSHVMITNLDGSIITLNRYEIKKIVPYYKGYKGKLNELEIK